MEYSDNFANISSQTLGMIFTHGINLLGAIFIMSTINLQLVDYLHLYHILHMFYNRFLL